MPPNAAGPMTMPNQPKPPTVSKPPTAAPGNFKINANTRNAPPQALSDSNSITAAALAKAGPNEQKQILGEALCKSYRCLCASVILMWWQLKQILELLKLNPNLLARLPECYSR